MVHINRNYIHFCIFLRFYACRSCCNSSVADYHVHCGNDAVRLRDLRLFQCDPTVIALSALKSMRSTAGLKRSAEYSVDDARSFADAEYTYDSYGGEGAQGVDVAQELALCASAADGNNLSFVAITEFATPEFELAPVKLYASLLQSFFMDAACPGVADGHSGSFCFPDWDEKCNKVRVFLLAGFFMQ
jgi:hypothetical protein